MPFWKSKSSKLSKGKSMTSLAPAEPPPSAPPTVRVQVLVPPEIQVQVNPELNSDELNNNHSNRVSKCGSSGKSTPRSSPKNSPRSSPGIERKSIATLQTSFGVGRSTDALNNLQISSTQSSRYNTPRGSVSHGSTLLVPHSASAYASRQSSFDMAEFDSGTGSMIASEDENAYLERVRASSGTSNGGSRSGSSRPQNTRGSTSSTSSSTKSGADLSRSSHSIHVLTESADRLRKLSASSFAFCLENAKQLFETKWELALEAERNPNLPPITTKADFYKHTRIGQGCYGDIFLVQHKNSRQFHAMKVCSKAMAKKKNQLEGLKYERRILASLTFPFVTTLQYYFEDSLNTYTVMEFVAGGDMFYHLRKRKYFPESQVQFYAAQLVLTLEYLHAVGLVFRDLKPENVLIDVDGYLKLTDFGLSKRIDAGRRWTFCGTPEYIAPEIILCKGYSKAVDWWSLGILLYEMYVGHPPFQGETALDIYERIVSSTEPIKFSRSHPKDLKDLTQNLLQVDLTRRFGNLRNGVNDIKFHRWFAKTNWESIYRKQEKPPMVPSVRHPGDSRNFPL